MSIQIKLHVEDKVINLLDYQQLITQNTDYTGRPSAKSVVQPINFSFETGKNDPFLAKLISGKMSDYLKFVISPVSMNGKSTTIEIKDWYVVKCYEEFDSTNNKPMITYVEITFAIIIINGVVLDVKYWKVTDPHIKNTPITTINRNEEEDEEPDVIEYYLTDTKNNRIEENLKQEIGNTIILNVHSKNLLGELLTFNLDNEEVDYKHKGTVLTNDTLTDYQINKNIERIELEVIKQKN